MHNNFLREEEILKSHKLKVIFTCSYKYVAAVGIGANREGSETLHEECPGMVRAEGVCVVGRPGGRWTEQMSTTMYTGG